MESNSTGLMGLLTQKMSYLNQRQSVLAENVANASTPNYKARDLTPFTFGDALKQASVGIAVTDPHHIVPASMAGVNSKTVKVKGAEVVPTGNSVDMEGQMMEVSKNAVEYQAMTSIYHKMIGLFKIAIKGSST
jgi:flagellar basal-body rod protein FlgB